MLGTAQEQWLDAGLEASRARWQVLANQVRVAPFDERVGAGERVHMDAWSGYPAALSRLMTSVENRAPNRTVALTGDIHSSWVNELRTQYHRPDGKAIGAEFIGTSISSGGDGVDAFPGWNDGSRAENPQCIWHNGRRGYVICDVGSDEWKASYRVVPVISRPGGEVNTAAEFVVQNGRPGVTKV